MGEKIKIDFLIVSKYTGEILKQSSIYVHALSRAMAEAKAYEVLKKESSPNSDDIILIDKRE